MRVIFKKCAIVLSLALIPSVSFADDEGGGNGFFAGLDIGYSVGFIKTIKSNNTETSESIQAPNYISTGLKLGYNYFFIPYFGVRGYLDYNYGFNLNDSKTTEEQNVFSNSSTLTSSHNITINVDVMFNFLSTEAMSLGVYAGIGLGYNTSNTKSTTSENGTTTTINQNLGGSFILPINSLSVIASSHHKIDLGFKIPTLASKTVINSQKPGKTTTTFTRDLYVFVGYSYIF